MPLFDTLTSAQLKLLAFTSEVLQYEKGEYLLRQGGKPDGVYVILSGRVEVIENTGRFPLNVDNTSSGALLGEMAVIRDEPRSASVIAVEKVEALKIPGERFLELITSNSHLARFVLKDLSTKLATATLQISQLQKQVKD